MKRKICVIGAGRWGKNHVQTLHTLDCLGGIVESNPAVLSAMKKLYPAAEIYPTIEAAISKDFAGFIIATPAETHFKMAEFVLTHHKPALVEKPISLTVADARRLKAISEETRVNLMVGHVLLFHPAIRRIQELIGEGKIGQLQYLYSNRLNLGTVRTEENILWSFAPHDLSIFQYFIGKMPIEVISRGGIFLQPHIHDTTLTVLRYPDNIVGHIFVSWLHPFKEHRLVVVGSKGMLSYEDSSAAKDILFYEKGIDWVEGKPINRNGPTAVISYERKAPLAEELRYFIENLGKYPFQIADPQSAIDVLAILEKASGSLEK